MFYIEKMFDGQIWFIRGKWLMGRDGLQERVVDDQIWFIMEKWQVFINDLQGKRQIVRDGLYGERGEWAEMVYMWKRVDGQRWFIRGKGQMVTDGLNGESSR